MFRCTAVLLKFKQDNFAFPLECLLCLAEAEIGVFYMSMLALVSGL